MEKDLGKDHSSLSMKHGNIINPDLPLAWWNLSFSLHPKVQKGRLFARIVIYFKTCYILRKRKKKWHLGYLFWKIFCFASVTPHLLNNFWDECITWFFLWRGKKEEKNNSHNSLEEQHGIKNGKGGTSDTFHLPSTNTVWGMPWPQTPCQKWMPITFFKCDMFSTEFDFDLCYDCL